MKGKTIFESQIDLPLFPFNDISIKKIMLPNGINLNKHEIQLRSKPHRIMNRTAVHSAPAVSLNNFCLILLLLIINTVSGQQLTPQKNDSLLLIAEQSDDPLTKMKIYNRLASDFMNHDFHRSFRYAKLAQKIAEEHQNKEHLLESQKLLGGYYLRSSKFDSSLYHNLRATALALELDDAMNEANLLRDRGRIFYLQGKYPQALEATFRAATIFETLGNKPGLATSYNSIGNIYLRLDNFKESFEYGLKALDICYEIEDKIGVINITGNLAINYSNVDSLEKAIEFYEIAIETSKQLNYQYGIALNKSNLALSYLVIHRYNYALNLLNEANNVYSTMNAPDGIAMTYGNIGETYLRNLRYMNEHGADEEKDLIRLKPTELLANAIANLEKALEIYHQIGVLPAIAYFSEQLSQAYEQKGNFNKSLEYFKIYAQTQDSIKKTESKIKIEELTTQREIDLANKQIELDRLAVIKKRNERVYFIIGLALLTIALAVIYRNLKQLRETQEQLIITEKQKEKALVRARISQDIHDDISSGLTKISWLAELLKARSSQANTPPDEITINKIINFSKESVAKLGEIIWSTNPERDNLESLLAYMRNYINGYMEGLPFDLKISFEEGSHTQKINPELRRNLYLVMKEALHNAVKYSEATQIEISFALNGNKYTLQVSDNGKGMGEGAAKGGGFGTGNMRRRMESVNGTFDFVTAPGLGTKVIFSGDIF